ncbi:putative inactive ATP-dependent zinc metalloprotease FTSHI 4, chloroplastic [Stylosanthes scabra]|uniref:Inactive ATP-dependent zinc metalloprotease FTSHI 4, chloroplastic n=1 Tax=Stylosanthes scabra TaxID=79078 RepID=A0ABU6RDR7_9FABA|nr:putative inactive ATP-dependent zinc metalloprotease FTSHI 4, chloroplastic [Stylosanthes scabra]
MEAPDLEHRRRCSFRLPSLPAGSLIHYPLLLRRYYVPLQHHRSCLFPLSAVLAACRFSFGPGDLCFNIAYFLFLLFLDDRSTETQQGEYLKFELRLGMLFFAANGTNFVEIKFRLSSHFGPPKIQVMLMYQYITIKGPMMKVMKHASLEDANYKIIFGFSPSIIFIDEIDAIGSKRGRPDIGGGGAEREQGLLQILTEFDGFKVSTAQVLVIGATNRLDILDPALLREGRFDKIIRVGLPSKDRGFAILKVHARNKFFRSEEEKETLLREIAELTEDFTGAELQNILNEAGILTARKDLDYIGRDELLEALKRQK